MMGGRLERFVSSEIFVMAPADDLGEHPLGVVRETRSKTSEVACANGLSAVCLSS